MNSRRSRRILAIDPGTRYMGIAVLSGARLVRHGVETLRADGSPHRRITEARRVVRRLIRGHRPHLLAVETAFIVRDRNSPLLVVLVEEIRSLARKEGLEVRSLTPASVKKRLCGDGRATKREVARAVVARYPHLAAHLDRGGPKERRYYGNMFDAVALGVASVGVTNAGAVHARLA